VIKQKRLHRIFDARNSWVASAEQHEDGWHVYAGGLQLGVVASPEAAEALIARIHAAERGDQ